MIFEFRNSFDRNLEVFFEPSTDFFTLSKGGILKIDFIEGSPYQDYYFDLVEKGLVLYFPAKARGKVYINDKAVETLFEICDCF